MTSDAGKIRYDLRVTGAEVLSTTSGETFAADLLIVGDRIRALPPPGTPADAEETIDGTGLTAVPGYIDAHTHIESSFLTPGPFAEATLSRGTTTVLADPHEIVNVAGAQGMRWMMDRAVTTRQSVFWAVPSCVPAMPGFETSGADLGPEEIDEMLGWPSVLALGEVMDYRAVVSGDYRMEAVTGLARRRGVLMDGHCPGLSGEDLDRYLWAGIDSDHCKNAVAVSLEKVRRGMTLMLQEKCLSAELVDALLGLPLLPPLCLVTDDLAADVITCAGHLDHIARQAVKHGLPPLEALRAITLNPAQRLRLNDRGVIAPGKRADVLLVRDPSRFVPEVVVSGGTVVARSGSPVGRRALPPHNPFRGTVHLSSPDTGPVEWRVDLPDGDYAFTALRTNPDDTFTERAEVTLPVRAGLVGWEGRVAILTVVERHTASARRSFAPVTGFALGPGAVATSYAHDSHNLTAVGTDAGCLRDALNGVIADHGGICLVERPAPGVPTVTARLPLPVGGVMSDRGVDEVARLTAALRQALRDWGWRHANPLMSISTLALPVSPTVKLSDRGLINVTGRRWEPAVKGMG